MILARYVLREHIAPFFYAFAVITFLFIMDFMLSIVDNVFNKGLGLRDVLEFFIMNMAWMVALSLPMAVLIASLMAFGRLSADNEIIALKASGISSFRIVRPALIAAILVAAGLMWFNNRVLPEANHRAAILQMDIAQKKPSAFIKAGFVIDDFPGYRILVGRVNPLAGDMQAIKIYQEEEGRTTVTFASRGTLEYINRGEVIRFTLQDGESHREEVAKGGDYFRSVFTRQVVYIDNVDSKLRRTQDMARGDREMSAAMMMVKVREYKKDRLRETASLTQKLQTVPSVADSQLSGIKPVPFDFANVPMDEHARALEEERKKANQLTREKHLILNADRLISKYMVEVHKKYSIPVACLVFVLIGAPLGIMARAGGIGVGAAYSIAFFLLYWIFLIGGENLADNLVIPAWAAMWAPNLLMGAVGIWLVVRMVQEKDFMLYQTVMGWARRLRAFFPKGEKP